MARSACKRTYSDYCLTTRQDLVMSDYVAQLPALQALRSGKCCPIRDVAGGAASRPSW